MMKRILIIAAFVLTSVLPALSIGYEEARQQAWFLTDKMAYELNLTPEQYDRAYQTNLDYFLSISDGADQYGRYWDYRNADLRCILFDWQYSLFSTLDYFFRPVRWVRVGWYYPIFDRYRRGYYYFDRPTIYVSYHGGLWHRRGHNDISPYYGMKFRPGGGLRDRYHAGHGNGRPAHKPEYGRPPRPGDNCPHRPEADRRHPDYGNGNGHRLGTGIGTSEGKRPGNDGYTPGRRKSPLPASLRNPAGGRDSNKGHGRRREGGRSSSRFSGSRSHVR